MNWYKLKVDIPFLKKGDVFAFDIELGNVYSVNEKSQVVCEYPLRQGLAGYLWLLRTEKKYFRKVN